jgi:hypothetical protein
MKRALLCSSLALALASPLAFADSGPGCGLGAQVWKGKTGLVAHTSAGTTNGTVTSPLAGLVSGTSGCENPGVVSNEYQKKTFVSMNMDDLAKDIAQGSGDYLTSMAALMGIAEADQKRFFELSQSNYEVIFSSATQSYDDVIAALNEVVAADSHLAHYVVKS